MIIGITGGSGSGKTTLLSVIREAGGLILDCDAVYHELLGSDPELVEKIGDRFPGTVSRGILDRKKLGEVVFNDGQALEDLNGITHRAVYREVCRRIRGREGLVGIDAAALFESGLGALCQVTVAVTAPRETRILRLEARDGIPEAYARSRIEAQKPDAWFEQRCTAVLVNDGTPQEFHEKCLAFLRQFAIIKEET